MGWLARAVVVGAAATAGFAAGAAGFAADAAGLVGDLAGEPVYGAASLRVDFAAGRHQAQPQAWATKRARAATSCRPWTESDAELQAHATLGTLATQTHHLFPKARLTGHSCQINVFFCSRAPLRVTTQYQSSSASPRRLSPPGQAH